MTRGRAGGAVAVAAVLLALELVFVGGLAHGRTVPQVGATLRRAGVALLLPGGRTHLAARPRPPVAAEHLAPAAPDYGRRWRKYRARLPAFGLMSHPPPAAIGVFRAPARPPRLGEAADGNRRAPPPPVRSQPHQARAP